jgi:hypothetical protein
MKNLWSYCGLIAARISASDKDLPENVSLIFYPSPPKNGNVIYG